MEEQNQPLPCPIADESALMSLRATLLHALESVALIVIRRPGYAADLVEGVHNAIDQLNTLLGITEDNEEDFYAGDAEGEMRAEAEAERMADAAYEIACEGWTLDPYDGY